MQQRFSYADPDKQACLDTNIKLTFGQLYFVTFSTSNEIYTMAQQHKIQIYVFIISSLILFKLC